MLFTDGVLTDDARQAEFGAVLAGILAKTNIKAIYISGLNPSNGWRDLVAAEALGQNRVILSSLSDNTANLPSFITATGR